MIIIINNNNDNNNDNNNIYAYDHMYIHRCTIMYTYILWVSTERFLFCSICPNIFSPFPAKKTQPTKWHFGTAPELCLLLGRPHDVVSLVLARLACQLLGREELPEARRIIGAHHATYAERELWWAWNGMRCREIRWTKYVYIYMCVCSIMYLQ